MKKTRILFLSLFFLISASIGVFAADSIKKVDAFIRSDFQVFLDGKKTDITPILIYQNRSYLPLRQAAELLGVDVVWNAKNKGIYINQRYSGQPVKAEDAGKRYDLMNFYQPMMYKAVYLGGEHQLLTNEAYDRKMYYREKDLNYMGIDTRGLLKVREPLTDQLYVDSQEVSALWKETPTLMASYEFTIMNEHDEDRTQYIKDFIEYLPMREAVLRGEEVQPKYYYNPPLVYMIDALPDNEYNILTFQYDDSSFAWYTIQLKKSQNGMWYESGYSKKSRVMILN